MESCFELSKATDGQFRFALKGDNGKTLLASELYRSKDSAQAGIASVQKNAGSEERYEKKVATNGKFFFNLKAANSQVFIRRRPSGSGGARVSERSAMCWTMAPVSNITRSPSWKIGTWPNGCRAR